MLLLTSKKIGLHLKVSTCFSASKSWRMAMHLWLNSLPNKKSAKRSSRTSREMSKVCWRELSIRLKASRPKSRERWPWLKSSISPRVSHTKAKEAKMSPVTRLSRIKLTTSLFRPRIRQMMLLTFYSQRRATFTQSRNSSKFWLLPKIPLSRP